MGKFDVIPIETKTAYTIVSKDVNVCHSLLTTDLYAPCQHRCLYCYVNALGYVYAAYRKKSKPSVFVNRPELLRKFFRKHRDLKFPLRIGALSDVGPPYEVTTKLLWRVLRYALEYEYPILIITKVPLHKYNYVGKLLIEMADVGIIFVSVTITDIYPEFYRKIEPYAPKVEDRIRFLEWLENHKIPFSLRITPLFQGVTDVKERFIEILDATPRTHIIVEYLRVRGKKQVMLFKRLGVKPWDSKVDEKWKYYLAPLEYRIKNYLKLRDMVHSKGRTFAICGDVRFKISDYRDCCSGPEDFYGKTMPYKAGKSHDRKIRGLIMNLLPRTPLIKWQDADVNLAEI